MNIVTIPPAARGGLQKKKKQSHLQRLLLVVLEVVRNGRIQRIIGVRAGEEGLGRDFCPNADDPLDAIITAVAAGAAGRTQQKPVAVSCLS